MSQSVLIDHIYEAAVLPELWPNALSMICDEVGAHGGAIVLAGETGKVGHIATRSYADAFTAFDRSGLSYDSPRTRRHLARRHAGFLTDLDNCTQAELDADPVYSSVLYPRDIGWTSGTLIPVPTGQLIVIDLCSRRSVGPLDRAMLPVLDALRPHLARAALLTSLVREQFATVRVESLQAIGLPAAVIETNGRVLAANQLFEALTPRVGIGARDRLSLKDRAAHSLMASALLEHASVRSIPVRAEEGAPALILHLVPVRNQASDSFWSDSSIAYVTEVKRPAVPMMELLTGLFDLTAAEARIARALSSGLSAPDVAADLGVGIETVRTHLSAIFRKTGSAGQTDLARLLSGIPDQSPPSEG